MIPAWGWAVVAVVVGVYPLLGLAIDVFGGED